MHVIKESFPEPSALTYTPTTAYILHENAKVSGQNLVTTHNIDNKGEINAGTVMSSQHFQKLRTTFPHKPLQILPDNILAINEHSMVFFIEAKTHLFRVTDFNHPLQYRQYMIPMPSHILYVKWRKNGVELGGVAVKEKTKGCISDDSKLYFSPTFNTYKNGSMCLGSVKLKESYSVKNFAHWEECFFSSAGSNIKHKCINLSEGETASTKILSLANKSDFPLEYLKPNETPTLVQFLSDLER